MINLMIPHEAKFVPEDAYVERLKKDLAGALARNTELEAQLAKANDHIEALTLDLNGRKTWQD